MNWTLLYWFDGLSLFLIASYKLWLQLRKLLKKFNSTNVSAAASPVASVGPPPVSPVATPVAAAAPTALVTPVPTTTASWQGRLLQLAGYGLALAILVVWQGSALLSSITLHGFTIFALWMLALITIGYSVWQAWQKKNFKPVITAVALVIISAIAWYAFAAYQRSSEPTEVADTTVQDIVRPDHPVKVVMPRQYNAEITVDTDKVDQKIVWLGEKKVRVFTVKKGVVEVPITYRVFPCTEGLPCYSPSPTSQAKQPEAEEVKKPKDTPALPDDIPADPPN